MNRQEYKVNEWWNEPSLFNQLLNINPPCRVLDEKYTYCIYFLLTEEEVTLLSMCGEVTKVADIIKRYNEIIASALGFDDMIKGRAQKTLDEIERGLISPEIQSFQEILRCSVNDRFKNMSKKSK